MRLGNTAHPPALLAALAGRPPHELEFLPAALEVIDTPVPPAARLIPAAICTFCAAALVWAVFGRIDIVANAPGTVIPADKVKVVQPLAAGVVEAILVSDGDHVTAGQAVVRLDPVSAVSARDKAATDLAQARLDVMGLSALRGGIQHPAQTISFVAPDDATPISVEREHATILARHDEQQAKLANLAQQMAEKRVEAVENVSTIDKLQAELPMLDGIRDMYRKLYAARLTSRVNLLTAEQKYSDTAHDLAIQIEHGGEANANAAALARQYEAQQADYAHGVMQDLTDAEQRLGTSEAQYRAASHDAAGLVLRSPVTGTVQQVAVHSEGGVVTPAQKLMVIVPDNDRLVVEAMVANRDIGFVHPGQPVNVKIAAFNFTRYGLIPGHVIDISQDAVDDTPKDPGASAGTGGGDGGRAASASSEPDFDGGQGSGYIARIALDRDSVEVDGRKAKIGPGMSVTAEILTGKRRVVSYLLSPMTRYIQDAGRER